MVPQKGQSQKSNRTENRKAATIDPEPFLSLSDLFVVASRKGHLISHDLHYPSPVGRHHPDPAPSLLPENGPRLGGAAVL
jgi:hypothetical protein